MTLLTNDNPLGFLSGQILVQDGSCFFISVTSVTYKITER